MTRCSALLGSLALVAACGGGGGAPATGRPNLLLILSDDQRYDTLGCTGNAVAETPHLDRLAREGALFRRAYVTTSLCCPARASLLTGRYAHATGIRNNEDDAAFLADGRGLGDRLRAAGYRTAFLGKWHVPNPGAAPQPGFDYWVSFEDQGQYEDETFTIDGQRRTIEGFSTDVLTDLATGWLRKPRDRPFFLVLSVKNLHGPYFPPPRHRAAFADVEFPLPESYSDPVESLPTFIQRARTTLRNRPFEGEGDHDDFVRGYHQLLLSLDESVGRILACLEETGELDDTAIAFTSDGGFLWGEHGLYRKRAAYEPSIHVPLLVRYPAEIPAGTEIDRIALNVDLAPTFLELAGAEPPEGVHGRSLVPLWRGDGGPWREDFLYMDGWGKFVDGPQELAVCGERYKYVRFRREVVDEALFDRATDPDERVNLAADPAREPLLAELRGRMRAQLVELGAPAEWMEAE